MHLVHPLVPPQAVPEPQAAPSALPLQALMGRLTQVTCGPQGGNSTVAAALVATAQRQRQPTAWVQWQGGSLYPPDLHAQGVALASLLVVHVGDAAQAHPRLRATELLLRSAGFGLVVVDLTCGRLPSGLAWQHRLQHWARQHHSAVVLLTLTQEAGPSPSLGALIGLQLCPERVRRPDGLFEQHCAIGKSKLVAVTSPWQWLASGPPGLM